MSKIQACLQAAAENIAEAVQEITKKLVRDYKRGHQVLRAGIPGVD